MNQANDLRNCWRVVVMAIALLARMRCTVRLAACFVAVLVACAQPQLAGASTTVRAPIRTAAASPQPRPAEHSGKTIYDKNCAACHDNAAATRAPGLDTLKGMRREAISYALTQGRMQVQASQLTADERAAVIDFLAGKAPTQDDWSAPMSCGPERGRMNLDAPPTIAGFGFDPRNHRRLSAAQGGLATTDFRKLELAWVMAFPKATSMRSQPAVVGTNLFLAVADSSQLFAIDIAGPPCVRWVYRHDAPLRTSVAFGELTAAKRKVLVFGDIAANVHMVDAATGERIWMQHVGLHRLSLTTGTPVLHADRVYVPISQYEIMLGANRDHECCKTHGAVTALDARTGAKIWTTHTMQEARPVRDRGDGKMIWGPSGAPIWTSPAIDAKRGVLYVGTGEATSEPAAPTTDAILAIDLDDGSIRWSFQATANDIFLAGCVFDRTAPNCPKNGVFRDVDFGASVVIAQRADGSDLLLAGQKSGTLWALDPDQRGKVLWRRDFGEGSPLGGIHWGIATDGERVFAPINWPYGVARGADATQHPGLHAVKVETGEVLWTFESKADCSGERAERIRACASSMGFSAAPVVIDGAVVQGGVDGMLRAFDARTGEVLFAFDTARPFQTINGVQGRGGSIDNASIVAANGYLLVSSGYGMFGQMPGNVLLAFVPKASR
ncbi:outer membrane protein assembly factor BamB family protein [Peristeroidobacter soli]|uniref:outer membrane protein assembly factor BamB family protein n=1 Tax=Peristeroidobacter soli TaxID=2497877 RepID=UPI00101DB49C|nr:PQQ-binding-like beta-propeller repeat protein [Peristeroidobacter soli]